MILSGYTTCVCTYVDAIPHATRGPPKKQEDKCPAVQYSVYMLCDFGMVSPRSSGESWWPMQVLLKTLHLAP